MLTNEILSALMNVLLLAGIPFLFYVLHHTMRRKRSFGEVLDRAGLRLGEPRYIGYSAVFAFVQVVLLLVWPPDVEGSLREGSAFRHFGGLGLGAPSVGLALVYGIVKTGFAEEFLFRGLIAGSLGRRLRLRWANLAQAAIFLLPHLAILAISPEMWPILPLVFVGSLFLGWVRIRSGSIVGPWLVHAALNVAMGLSVAARSA